MNAPKFTLTNESISVYWESKMYTVQKGSPHFRPLFDAIHDERWADIPGHLTIQKSLNSWAQGKFKIENDTVFYDGNEVPRDINKRIVAMHAEGQDPSPLFKFWERLSKNPSKRSVDQLYPFLAHEKIPLTKDGCFLAYKAVRNDYLDKHSGTISNKPGVTVKMPRNKISDDPREACHEGLHVGAIGYVNSFGSTYGGDRFVICKVDPEHVVCVPYDHSQEKMRVCEYRVIGNLGDPIEETVHDDPLDPGSAGYEEHENAVDKSAEGSSSSTEDDDEDDDPNYDPEEDPLSDKNMGLPSDDDAPEDIETGPTDGDEETTGKVVDLMNEEADEGVTVVRDEEKKPAPKKTPEKKAFSKHGKMGTKELMDLSLDDLRKYATYGLQIVGASKIPGGKTALVARIIKQRKL